MPALDEFLSLTEAVADAGFGLKTFKDVPTSQVFEALHRAGYSEVVTDGGRVMWTKPWWNTTGATSTATAGETMGQNLISTVTTEAGAAEGLVNITASSVGFTTEAASVTQGISMIATTPKLAVVTAVASACGLAFGFDLGQELVDLYFGDDNFDWSTDSIGAKVISYISGDKTYVDEDLVNRIKDRLIDIGAFDDNKYTPPTDNVELNIPLEINGINFQVPDFVPAQYVTAYTEYFKTAFASVCKELGNYTFRNGDFLQISAWTVNDTKYDMEIYVKIYATSDSEVVIYKIEPDNSYLTYLNEFLKNNNGKSNAPKVSWFHCKTSKPVREGFASVLIDFDHPQNAVYNSNGFIPTTEFYFGVPAKGANTERTYYNIGTSTKPLPGVNKQQDATYPTKGTPVSTTYPNWGADKGKVPIKDGEKVVLPLKLPKPDEGTKPQAEAQKGTYPEPDPYIGDLIDGGGMPSPPVPTGDTGDTPTPPIPAVGVEATGFVAIYNPTQKQLSDFSRYLWSNEFLDNFIKLFANPMDAIIGLHIIYATPSRGTDAEIVCGYAHSGVTSKTVNKQYIELDCGSIKVNRYFGNVLDYSPYTTLQAYLPFVGIVDLDTNEIMDGTLNIKYRIDVLTGSCLARLKVTRGSYSAELYNFAGNCAVQLPISGGSYSGIIANAIGVAGSIGATIATGGALAPVLVGSAVSSAVNSHVNVSHSGSLGSNAGALGIMKPYLIITRPKPAEAINYSKFYGIPSNMTVKLSSCSGYTRVKYIHLENISRATDDELNEIDSLLKEGVII